MGRNIISSRGHSQSNQKQYEILHNKIFVYWHGLLQDWFPNTPENLRKIKDMGYVNRWRKD